MAELPTRVDPTQTSGGAAFSQSDMFAFRAIPYRSPGAVKNLSP